MRQPMIHEGDSEEQNLVQAFDQEQAEIEVEQAHQGEESLESHVKMSFDDHGNSGNRHGHGGEQSLSAITPPASNPFEFSFPPTHTTPNRSRKRQPPPPSIPNFPSSHEPRNPPPAIPFSPSPTHSPAASSPFRSPDPPASAQPSSSRSQGFSFPVSQPSATPLGGGMNSPWLSLAATSGAPTPSLESGPMGKASPHLGYPFERLNIGGSWSGANLWGEGAQGRRNSQDSTGGSGTGSSPNRNPQQLSSPPPISLPPPPARGLSSETLQRYKAMASGTALPLAASKGSSDQSPKASGDAGLTALPAALAKRRGSLPKATTGQALSLPPSRAGKSPSPLASTSTTSSPGAGGKRIQPISPRALQPLVNLSSTLILDVRPPSSFQLSHIPSSHSLPIPSTLLRRPAFDLQKLAQMLSPRSTEAVNAWREKSDVVLVDADSGSVPDGSVLDGLSSKFDREGYTGHLWFVKGGHLSIRTNGAIPLISEEEEGNAEAESTTAKIATNAAVNKGLMAGRLGTLAFQQESTGSGRKGRAPPPTGLSMPPTPGFSLKSNPFGISMPGSQASSATERPNTGNTAVPSPSGGNSKPKFQPANPFFDNIRQNLELSHGGITERIPLNLPDTVTSRAEELPEFLKNLVTMPEKDSMDALAKQFYDLELSEQQRLQTVMEWHSNGSGAGLGHHAGREDWTQKRRNDAEELQRLVEWRGQEADTQADYFPFSITAGVERGTKNRYKNIWPYDFSRVRLETPPDQDSDYINASFVQPRGTARRYIATQGPLDATFHDFWTLVWEQGVRVIVMITKQFEGGLVKCGNYWCKEDFGSLHLTMVQQTGGEDHAQQPTTGFDFGSAAITPSSSAFPSSKERNIKRIFKLTNDAHPEEPPRTITQIQCVGWPDFDVPETPEILGDLIKEVDQAVDDSEPDGSGDRSDQPPVLVHCSAGVGRTGSFIVVDAILDGLRRELRKRRGSSASSVGDAAERVPTSKEKSGDSGKAVSFLSPPTNTEFSFSFPSSSTSPDTRPVFSSSPSPMPSIPVPVPGSSLTAENLAQSNQGEKMDVDHPTPPAEDERDGPPSDPRFFQHRGSISTTVSSETGLETRRPSLVSTQHSSDTVPQEARKTSNQPAPVTRSHSRHRTPSPITELNDPVRSVLEGMRVQRMSLVQSLRQYLFVHRAIITNYLHIVDEESAGAGAGSVPGVPPRPANPTPTVSGSTTSTLSNSASGSGSLDDDGHSKRRASPTELELEAESILASRVGSGLSKRPSFKKMRQGVEGMASPISGGSTTGASGPSATPGSPSKGRFRSKSKLGLSVPVSEPVPLPGTIPLPVSSPMMGGVSPGTGAGTGSGAGEGASGSGSAEK